MIKAIPNNCVGITPSNTEDLPAIGIVFVGTGGNVKVTTLAGDDVTILCPSGYEIKCLVKKVFALGTDADDLVLYYDK